MAVIKNVGKVLEVKDGIVFADGLSDIGYNEGVRIHTSKGIVEGLALNLDEKSVGIIVLGDFLKIKEGDEIETTGKLLSIFVSDTIVGNIINPLGISLETGKKVVTNGEEMLLEKVAPGVIDRKNISSEKPLQTGIISIDAMIPIGRGQRELIIGDRQTGKTALCLDTILNQKGKNIICIYVAIGQKASKIAQIKAKLKEKHSLEYTVIVAANASDPAGLQYIAPYAGCAIGEYFAEKGKDALIVYDDLTKHAWAYREISLLLKRPPGREAYPGDIFYLHSRLLERAAQLSDKRGGGSLTALPIIETQAGDVSAYIPTNIISITDGQIFLEADLFYAGQRPAVNVGISVSRVGGSAQIKAMKQVSGKLKLDLAQFRELQAFAQFGSDLDEETKNKLVRGEHISELLKQDQFDLMSIEEQIVLIFAGVTSLLDKISINTMQEWKKDFRKYLSVNGKEIIDELKVKKEITPEFEKRLKKFIMNYPKK